MRRSHVPAEIAVVVTAVALGACGGSSGSGPTASSEDAARAAEASTATALAGRAAAAAPAPVPAQAATASQSSTSGEVAPGIDMPPLHSAAAAQQECGAVSTYTIALTYGGVSTDPSSVAGWFALRRAASGDRDAVRSGCLAGLRS